MWWIRTCLCAALLSFLMQTGSLKYSISSTVCWTLTDLTSCFSPVSDLVTLAGIVHVICNDLLRGCDVSIIYRLNEKSVTKATWIILYSCCFVSIARITYSVTLLYLIKYALTNESLLNVALFDLKAMESIIKQPCSQLQRRISFIFTQRFY